MIQTSVKVNIFPLSNRSIKIEPFEIWFSF